MSFSNGTAKSGPTSAVAAMGLCHQQRIAVSGSVGLHQTTVSCAAQDSGHLPTPTKLRMSTVSLRDSHKLRVSNRDAVRISPRVHLGGCTTVFVALATGAKDLLKQKLSRA